MSAFEGKADIASPTSAQAHALAEPPCDIEISSNCTDTQAIVRDRHYSTDVVVDHNLRSTEVCNNASNTIGNVIV
jgi:hypothetical protein